jgi:hypothetical protein
VHSAGEESRRACIARQLGPGAAHRRVRPAACYRAAKFFADAAVICGIA